MRQSTQFFSTKSYRRLQPQRHLIAWSFCWQLRGRNGLFIGVHYWIKHHQNFRILFTISWLRIRCFPFHFPNINLSTLNVTYHAESHLRSLDRSYPLYSEIVLTESQNAAQIFFASSIAPLFAHFSLSKTKSRLKMIFLKWLFACLIKV